jgi:NCAIR mutase (PurE)-related protein
MICWHQQVSQMNLFDDLRNSLSGSDGATDSVEVNTDVQRVQRSGVPEVVLAAGKSVDQIAAAVDSLLAGNGRVIVSRTSPSTIEDLRLRLGESVEVVQAPGCQAALISLTASVRPSTGGRVAVISAGTSDVGVASEAALMATEMGCDIRTAWDVGVAGIHRLVRPLEQLTKWDPDVFVVAAGMDGILPTVVCGLVAQPVIALPISTGYGFGGGGLGALTTMLQSCAPGLAVVNIDNGIGAGAMAALIANRAARFRQVPPEAMP